MLCDGRTPLKIASRDVAQPPGGCHAETACRHRRRRRVRIGDHPRSIATRITLGQSQLEIEANELWFVELSSPPTADGTAIAALEREEASFHAAAASAGIRYAEGRHFRSLWNGLTVRASVATSRRSARCPGVQAVYPVTKVYPAQDVEQPPGTVADLVTALRMTGADIAQSELGLTGRGVRVAVIDSGIDYDHPDLGGCFGRGCRVAKGFDLVGDAFNRRRASPSFNPVPTPDPFPDDCDGHGTHVAGIIGANGDDHRRRPGRDVPRLPGLRLRRADDRRHPARRHGDGARRPRRRGEHEHRLRRFSGRSLRPRRRPTAWSGAASPSWPRSATKERSASTRPARRRRQGRDRRRLVRQHAREPRVVHGVAWRPAGRIRQAAKARRRRRCSAPFPCLSTGTPTSIDDACARAAGREPDREHRAHSPRHLLASIRRRSTHRTPGPPASSCTTTSRAASARRVAGVPPITIPVVSILAADGVAIHDATAAEPSPGPRTVRRASRSRRAELISSFSSWGLAADLSFKPDLGAPGGSVRSTLPIEQGSFGSVSGTSMASPHVAGAVALLLEARPRYAARGSAGAAAEQCAAAPVVGRPRARPPRQRASPGRRHADDRRRDRSRCGGHPEQPGARRARNHQAAARLLHIGGPSSWFDHGPHRRRHRGDDGTTR